MDYVGPAAGAAVFVLLMSLVQEPARRSFNAIFVGRRERRVSERRVRSVGVALSGDRAPVVYLGLRSHRFIGARLADALRLGSRAPPLG